MVGYTEIGHKRGSRRSVVMSANRTSSEAGRFPWLPCRSAPDRVCRAAFDHSRCVMDTCGLERVERVRINLNEKNLASQRNTLYYARFPNHSSVHRGMYRPRSVKMQWQSWKVQCFSAFPIYKQNHNGGRSKTSLVKGGALPRSPTTKKGPLALGHLSL